MPIERPLYEYVSRVIKKALTEVLDFKDLSLRDIQNLLSSPPKKNMGHVAFPCFILAKSLKKSPPIIATSLLEHISLTIEETSFGINFAQSFEPYINFTFSKAALEKHCLNDILTGAFFKAQLFQNPPSTMLEYSQPNTHKELHVGHMRNLCLGNSLVRLLRHSGHQVFSVTYPGDVGTHVAKCLWYLKYHNKSPSPEGEKGAWLGEMYSKASVMLAEQKGTDQEESNRIELTKILQELESGTGEYYNTWKETRTWSIDLMKAVYKWADVKFDRWFWESEVDAPSMARAKSLYAQKKLVLDHGAIGMDLKEQNLGFCLMIKSDGNGLYATKDIELAYKKFEDYPIEKSLYLVDKRQAYHFKQVFAVLENLGHQQASACLHLQYDFVELPDGPMSSRDGNIIPIIELIDKMESTITSHYLERYRGVWTEQEILSTAKIVANGAIKYGMLRMDNDRKIIFNMNDWLKLDGETGPYLQYVHARINALITKFGPINPDREVTSLLTAVQEEALLVKLDDFNQQVYHATKNYRPSLLCSYLYELGKLYNSFYAECAIGTASDTDLKEARLALSGAVALVMKKGLELLGIEAPLKM